MAIWQRHISLTPVLDVFWPRICAVKSCLRVLAADEEGFVCRDCLAALPRDRDVSNRRARAVFAYDGAVPQLVQDFKFRGQRYLAGTFSRAMAETVRRHFDISDERLLLVPVPLHPTRLKERGFNQSELLARGIARRLGLKTSPHALERIRDTPHQARSSRERRLENLQKAFAAPDADIVRNKTIILIDDVTTTGTTCEACAAPLLAAGARSVAMLALARTIYEE